MRPAEHADPPVHVVGQQHLLEELERTRPWTRSRVDPVVDLGHRQIAVREGEEAEVVVALDMVVDVIEHHIERHGLVDHRQVERRHHLQGDGGDQAQRAEPFEFGYATRPAKVNELGIEIPEERGQTGLFGCDVLKLRHFGFVHLAGGDHVR